MLIFFAVLGGFILDAIFGDPLWLPHPVVYMGKVISFLDRSLRKILPKTPRGERIGGAITAFILPVGTFLLSGAVCFFFYKIHWVFGLLIQMFWCAQSLSTRSSKRTTSPPRARPSLALSGVIPTRFPWRA